MIGIFVLVPIVAILTRHQQKIAELVNRSATPERPTHDPRVLQELFELKDRVSQQALLLMN